MENNKAVLLTEGERRIYDLLSKYQNGFIRPHLKQSGARCFRLVTNTFSPVSNIESSWIEKLIEKGALTLEARTDVGRPFTLKNLNKYA
jgi:hypothetical protein